MEFLQKFHLVIRYKKCIFNKVADMLSRPIISASTLLKNDYHMHKNFLFHLGKLCIPQGERLSVMREAHSSLIVGHFGVSKTVV